MPLEDSEWSKGKCSYKFLLYASCAVPTITSPVGMNQDVLQLGRVGLPAATPAEWRDALEYCFARREALSAAFPDCRSVAVENFSAATVRAQIAGILRQGSLAS
jgi:glycosyltransferase involved in cell wall biosynthesis